MNSISSKRDRVCTQRRRSNYRCSPHPPPAHLKNPATPSTIHPRAPQLGLYLKQYMGYPADTASQLLQVWKATVYLTPLLGAFLADAYLGRFWVILIFSILCESAVGWVELVG
jgi:hypothetical protein